MENTETMIEENLLAILIKIIQSHNMDDKLQTTFNLFRWIW